MSVGSQGVGRTRRAGLIPQGGEATKSALARGRGAARPCGGGDSGKARGLRMCGRAAGGKEGKAV